MKMKKYVLFLCSLFIVMPAVVALLPAATFSQEAIGEQRVLVIMVKFPDVDPSFSIEEMRSKYFGRLNQYLKAVSYNKTWISGKMTEWYTLPHGVGSYRLSQHNLVVKKEKVVALITDAVNLADKDEDFSQYSMIFISLGAKKKDYGMMGLCGYPGMLGWQNQLPLKTKERGQKIPGGVAIYCENAHVGVVFHDMAHIMGGVQRGKRILPCLYDHDLQAQQGPFRGAYQFYLINVGFFDPMSCHFYKLNQGPPGVCAWTKLRLNWIDSDKITEISRGESKTVVLGPLGKIQSPVQVIKLPLDATTYYVIENRQPIGPDRNLPSHGVLIYYCDDKIAECRHGTSPITLVNANPSVPQLKGAPFTFEGNRIFEDRKRGVSIKILDQQGEDYKVYVSNSE